MFRTSLPFLIRALSKLKASLRWCKLGAKGEACLSHITSLFVSTYDGLAFGYRRLRFISPIGRSRCCSIHCSPSTRIEVNAPNCMSQSQRSLASAVGRSGRSKISKSQSQRCSGLLSTSGSGSTNSAESKAKSLTYDVLSQSAVVRRTAYIACHALQGVEGGDAFVACRTKRWQPLWIRSDQIQLVKDRVHGWFSSPRNRGPFHGSNIFVGLPCLADRRSGSRLWLLQA